MNINYYGKIKKNYFSHHKWTRKVNSFLNYELSQLGLHFAGQNVAHAKTDRTDPIYHL